MAGQTATRSIPSSSGEIQGLALLPGLLFHRKYDGASGVAAVGKAPSSRDSGRGDEPQLTDEEVRTTRSTPAEAAACSALRVPSRTTASICHVAPSPSPIGEDACRVEDHVATFHGSLEGPPIYDVALHPLQDEPPKTPEIAGGPDQTAHLVALAQEDADDVGSDEAIRTRDEGLHSSRTTTPTSLPT